MDLAADVQSQLRLLAEAASDLNSSLELADVFQKIARRVYQLVDCHLFCIMLWNEQEQVLAPSYSLKFGEHVEQEGTLPMGRGISGMAAAERRPIRVGDVTLDPRYIRFRHAEVDIRSKLAVPLLFRDRLVGVLDLGSLEPDLFTKEHEQLLLALASHIATALVNARNYERMQALEQRRQQELATAREVQMGLLPEAVPRLPGFEIGSAFAPARELAGDFYDFMPYPDGRVALVIGDVAGKATPAALYGSLSVGIIRGHVMEHPYQPAEMLDHLNEHLLPLQAENRFLAMTYGLIDAEWQTLTLASAAFPWPRLVRNGKIEKIGVAGLPLGLFRDVVYDELVLRLLPGDIVVLSSDGLEDCLHERGEKLSEARLDAWVRMLASRTAQEIANELIRISDPIAEGRVTVQAADDRTVVVIKVTGTPA